MTEFIHAESITDLIQSKTIVLDYIKNKYLPFYNLFFRDVYFNKVDVCCEVYSNYIRNTLPPLCIFIETPFTKKYKKFSDFADSVGDIVPNDDCAKVSSDQIFVEQGCFGGIPLSDYRFDIEQDLYDMYSETKKESLQPFITEPIYYIYIFGTVMDVFELKFIYEKCNRCQKDMLVYFYEITPEALFEFLQYMCAYGKKMKVCCTSIIFNPLYMLSYHAAGNCLRKYRARYLKLFSSPFVDIKYREECDRGVMYIDKVTVIALRLQTLGKISRLYRFYYMDELFIYSPKCLSRLYSVVFPAFVILREHRDKFANLQERGLKLLTS
jgi:hypothetical protein